MLKRFVTPRGLAIVGFLAVSPSVAMAYIDPGNGAYMVQALFTLIGAALFYVRHPVRTAKLLWSRLRGHGAQDELSAEQESITENPPAANDPALAAESQAPATAVPKQQG